MARRNKNKSWFKHTTMMSRRPMMRVPEGEDTGGGGGGENNTSSNSGGDSNNNSDGNNGGQGFNPAAFWNLPSSEDDKSPPEGSADKSNSGGGNQNQNGPDDVGVKLREAVVGFKAGSVFTPELAEEISKGNFDGVNKAIEDIGRESMKQALVNSAHLMQAYGQTLMTQMASMIEEKLGSRDNQGALEKEFPQLITNPGLKPQVEGIFNQALKLAKGNRAEAVESTKQMLKFMGKELGEFAGLNEPPSNPGDTKMTPSAASLVESLLQR